jgi:hypothetical protein
MDSSVTSIEAMAREFGETLFQRGFSKGVLHEFRPYQTTDVFIVGKHLVFSIVEIKNSHLERACHLICRIFQVF